MNEQNLKILQSKLHEALTLREAIKRIENDIAMVKCTAGPLMISDGTDRLECLPEKEVSPPLILLQTRFHDRLLLFLKDQLIELRKAFRDLLVHHNFAVCPFTVIVDSNEQAPYAFRSIPPRAERAAKSVVVQTKRQHLETGDYSIEGMEQQVTVERKSLADLYSTLGQGRERFEREFEQMTEFAVAAVVVEADWRDICRPNDPVVEERKAMDVLYAAVGNYFDDDVGLGRVQLYLETAWANTEAPGWQSQLNPRSVWGTIFSWSQRYPNVHWYAMGSRRLAELATFEILERFWRESQLEQVSQED